MKTFKITLLSAPQLQAIAKRQVSCEHGYQLSGEHESKLSHEKSLFIIVDTSVLTGKTLFLLAKHEELIKKVEPCMPCFETLDSCLQYANFIR